MPTYEYECTKCGKVFEEFQSITAEPLTTCPVEGCGGKVRRLFSPGAGFLFKGSGFYATDYRSDSYKKAQKAEGSSSTSSSSSETSSKKSDSGTSDSSKKSDTPKSD
jgi:putative FmdB family regulatory protein